MERDETTAAQVAALVPDTRLETRRVPLDSLHQDPANARAHGPENLAAIEASLRRFGQAEPLVVQASTGRVIGGNGRLAVMRALGMTDADVVELDVDDLTATALGIALNRSGELATWDDQVLADLLGGLREADALEGVGFEESELDRMISDLAGETEADVEDPGLSEPPEEAVSRHGDLWALGDHLLLCGDSTRPEDVRRVMGDDQAKLVATDPPYLVDYTGERPNDSGKDWTGVYREVDIADAESFFRLVFTGVLEVLAPHGAIYCWHAHKRQALIARIWEELGIVDHQQIVWVKPASVFGRVYWHFRHEPCVMGWRKGSQPEHDGKHEFNSVWEVDWEGKARVSTDHPTSKPVELFARPMRKHTKRGEVVFEPFSGSGSQLIAADRLGRRCRAIEISPSFVDVAVKRWEEATGKRAVNRATGAAFGDEA